ncbi:MAG TPA: acyl-CoA dehydrogenase [Candidatus Eremiobacteraceae bacterium]|nr:acyl-CoA dehydrogenase [Candidatus Eremiobacteraceae bacterium]
MDFTFTDEQQQLRKSVREFAEGEIAPHVMDWDESSHFPTEILPKLGEMGLMGVIFPEQYGGAGLGYIEYATVIEELARVDGSVGLFVAAHNSLCSNHIYKFGTEEQKKKYLVPLAHGKKLGAWSLTEPEAGSDAGGTRTTAVRSGKDWILNGAKTFTTNGGYADVCVAMAVTDKSKQAHGISAFILEKGMSGFRPGKKENKLGMRASDTSEVIFTDCRVPASQFLGQPGEGFVDSLKVLDGGRISIAALALGMAQGALEAATSYAKQRKQFGKSISEFQAIQFKLADMATQVEAARLLVYQAAWLADRKNVRFTRESSMAKLFASEVAVRVANECVQVHGGYGFIKDYPAEKFYRDVKLCTIGEGTSEIQRLVIARQLLGKS